MQERYYEDLLNFIKCHKNTWQNDLKKEPYFITTSQCPFKDEFGKLLYPTAYMLSYNQFNSDFTNKVVKACRGSIVDVTDINNPKMICTPFYKFVNHEQEGEDEIDWSTAKILDKIDGMLMKCWYSEVLSKWIWVTNNSWNIENKLPETLPSVYKENETNEAVCFWDVLKIGFKHAGVNDDWYNKLDKDYTYMFELVSPKTRIIVDYPKTELWYLGCRNKNTWLEKSPEEESNKSILITNFRHPEIYNDKTIEEVLTRCNGYKNIEKEGVVVRDDNFHRFKIKCNNYLNIKFAKHAIGLNDKFLLQCIREGTEDDLLSAFPTMKDKINEMKNKIRKFNCIVDEISNYTEKLYLTFCKFADDEKSARKEFADFICKNKVDIKYIVFIALKGKEAINIFKAEANDEKINNLLEFYDNLDKGYFDVS